jgi:hypothetical protein
MGVIGQPVEFWEIENRSDAFFFESGLKITAAGSPVAYHPDNVSGLDDLVRAGVRGYWWGLVTESGDVSGYPVTQQAGDPAPGFFVSCTALQDINPDPAGRYDRRDPRRYVNSAEIPYIALPPLTSPPLLLQPNETEQRLQFGDLAMVLNRDNLTRHGAVYADLTPDGTIQGSIALAQRIGVPSEPRTGGVTKGIVTVVFRWSRVDWPLSATEINIEAERCFKNWGGIERLQAEGMWPPSPPVGLRITP